MYRINTNVLSWNQRDKTLVGELSSCGNNFRLSRIYQDACDVGIQLQSHRTGEVATFYLAEEKHDNENDLLYMSFHPTPEEIKKNPRMRDVKVILFND